MATSNRSLLESRYGVESPIGVSCVHGAFDFSQTSAEDATSSPSYGEFDEDNFGVLLQTTQNAYVAFNGEDASEDTGILLVKDAPAQYFPFKVTSISVLKVDSSGTLKWVCIIGG